MTHPTRLLTLGLAALLAATPAIAQDSARAPRRAPGQPRETMPPRQPGLGGERGIDRLRVQLGLTDDQVRRLEALRATQAAKPNRAPDLLRARADYLQAMQGEGDLAAARRALERMNAIRTERQLARLEARQQMRAILTAEQRARLDAMRQGRGLRGARGWRDGRGGGMWDGRGWGRRPGAWGPARGMGRPPMGAPGFGPPPMRRGWPDGPPPAAPLSPDSSDATTPVR